MWEGGGGQDGVEGREWDNCNSIINKYIKKKFPREEKAKGVHHQFSITRKIKGSSLIEENRKRKISN